MSDKAYSDCGAQPVEREPPNKAFAIMLLSAAAQSGNDGAIRLAAQLAGAEPCDKCGYVWNHCKCKTHDRTICDCGAPLLRFMSLNKKCCPDCYREYVWLLKPKQPPMCVSQR